MRETILIDALEEIIEAGWQMGLSHKYNSEKKKEVITKALTDWASAPKEGLTDKVKDFLEEVIQGQNGELKGMFIARIQRLAKELLIRK